jgi:ubiquinol-cytochrome c reductase subunit 7
VIDDCIYEDKYVKEAIKRLPRQIREDRDFRISRALLLSNNKEVLPKDEWTKWEDVSLLLVVWFMVFNTTFNNISVIL